MPYRSCVKCWRTGGSSRSGPLAVRSRPGADNSVAANRFGLQLPIGYGY